MSKQNDFVTKSDLEVSLKASEERILAGTGKIFQALIKHMDERFGQVDKRFENIEGRLDRVERKLVNTIELTDDHSVRIVKLEKQPV